MNSPDDSLKLAKRADRLAAKGEHAEAIRLWKNALVIKPDFYEAWRALSRSLFHQGEIKKAIAASKRAEACDPLTAEFAKIQQAMGVRDHQRAQQLAQDMIAQHAYHPRAIFTLAALSAMQGRHEDRAALLKEASDNAPANLHLRYLSVSAYEDGGAFEKAIEAARDLAKLEPSFDNLWGLMGLYLRHGFYEELSRLSEKAYAACDADLAKRSEIDLLCGQALKILGHRDAAISSLRDCIKHKPLSGAPWWALADMKDYHFTDSDRAEMSMITARSDIAPEQRIQAGFALGKAYELEGQYELAMDAYDQANALHGIRGFSGEAFAGAIARLKTAWTPEALTLQAKASETDIIPVFILGMPRSGSTLVEQILASHSQIEGTIEMMVLPEVKRRAHLRCVDRLGVSYLEGIGRLGADDLTRLGLDYLEGSALYRKAGKAYVIDKLPNNFEHIGLIHKILPRARIIDVRRNPMDCGYSLYKQYFRAGADYSYDLAAIGDYYNGYVSLMDHWDAHLPGKVHRVSYEELVSETEAQVRALLAFLKLPFEAECLAFYKNKRPVRTASSEQVRQPIYTKSVEAWRVVEKRLSPLRESLGKMVP